MTEPREPDPTALSPTGLQRLGEFLAAQDVARTSSCERGEESAWSMLALLPGITTQEPGSPRRFGRFLLNRVLGQGRFGIVFLAEDPTVPRTVALKLPQLGVLSDPDLLKRFHRNVEAAGMLDHPGIVPVHEAGVEGMIPYVVSAYIEGPTLHRWLQERPEPVPIREAARIVAALARAVQHAHDRGVLHCDLKPSNVLLASGGREPPVGEETGGSRPPLAVFTPKITDFDLARLLHQDLAGTRTHLVAGSLPYMAPEQALGHRRDLTARCDVFALGVILYELLVGKTPFDADSDGELLRQLREELPLPPRRLRADVPRDLDAIVLKCLEKDPTQRYPSATELADDLDRFQTGTPTRARPVGFASRLLRWARRRPALAGLAVLSLVALTYSVALLGYLASERRRHEEDLEHTEREANLRVEAAQRETQVQEFHVRLRQVHQRRIEGRADWSGRNLDELATLARHPNAANNLGELRTEAAAALGAVDLIPGRTLQNGFKAGVVAFSADGRTLAIAERGWSGLGPRRIRVRLVDPATDRVLREMSFPTNEAFEREVTYGTFAHSIVFSPDGRWLVVGDVSGRLIRWDLADTTSESVIWSAHVADNPAHYLRAVTALAFTEDGSLLLSGSRNRLRRWDVARGWPQVGLGVAMSLPYNTPILPRHCWLRPMTGNRAFTAVDLHTVEWAGDMDHKPHYYHEGVFSRDGRLALTDADDGTQTSWVANTESGVRLLPLTIAGKPVRPGNRKAFSPEAKHLLTNHEFDRIVRLWDVAGLALLCERTVEPGRLEIAWHPSGRYAALTHERGVRLYDLTDRNVRDMVAVQPGHIRQFAVSPDGKALATQSWLGAADEVRRYALHQDAERLSFRGRFLGAPAGEHLLTLSSEGTAVLFLVGPEPMMRIYKEDGTLGLPCPDCEQAHLAPDGRLWVAGGHSVFRWDLAQKRRQEVIRNNALASRSGLTFQAVVAGRRYAVAGRRDGKLYLFDGEGRHLAILPQVSFREVRALALSPDESLLLAGNQQGRVWLIALPSGEVVRELPEAHHREVKGVAFAAGCLVTASLDGAIKLWSTEGELLLTLREGGPILQLAVSDQGRELTLLVEGEIGLRRWRLGRLFAELGHLGLTIGGPTS